MTFIDLFCGIGGFRLGLERTGHKCVWANDIDKYACKIYRKHFGKGELHERDIRAIKSISIPKADMLCAGFPCQAFSHAGKRKGFRDTRGTLFFEICRILWDKKINYFFLENVKGLLSHNGGRTFTTILQSLHELGYDCQWQVCNSKNYGVPQNRERIFIIGYIRKEPRPEIFPIKNSIRKIKKGKINKDVTTAIDGNYYKGIDNHGQRTIIVVHNLQKRSIDRPSIKKNKNAVGSGPLSRKDGLTYCLDSQSGQAIEGNFGVRKLTPLECERLQGFPDNWTEGISDTQRYKCIGNAVTVNVIEAIGERLKYVPKM
jgi:DNA (cytosine-5)-methyltransferase 1